MSSVPASRQLSQINPKGNAEDGEFQIDGLTRQILSLYQTLNYICFSYWLLLLVPIS